MRNPLPICIAITLFLVPALAAQQRREEEKFPMITKHIVVSAKLIADEGEELDRVSANVTVITREDIERSGAGTLQELLAAYAGVITYDNVGNGVESTIDLRGFADGTAMAVYVDGVRVNEPDDNRVNLELIDLGVVERIEIIPGGASFSHGNGAISGTLKIYTRRGRGKPFNELLASYGSFGTTRLALRSGSALGPHSYFLSYGFSDSDGFRENGEVRQHKFLVKYNFDTPRSHNLEIGFRYSSGELGNPGALTPAELERDRRRSPFNKTDFNRTNEGVFNIRYTRYFSNNAFLSLAGYRRGAEIELLTTGRSAAVFGGFQTKSDNERLGLAAQMTYRAGRDAWRRAVTAGFEVFKDKFDNEGFITSAAGEPAFQLSDRSTGQDTRAFYIQGSTGLGNAVTLNGGVRHDRVDMDFSEALGSADAKKFARSSAAGGLTLKIARGASVFFRVAQSFQTPTVNELFAFPLFGSNPDLLPATGTTFEGGFRSRVGGGMLLQAALYRIDLRNEVVFVITDPVFFIGRNENVGRSRRTGLELQLGGSPARDLDLFVSYTYTRAGNLSLAEALGAGGLRIPLVPDHKIAFRAGYSLGGLNLGAEGLYVGGQVMSSDDANEGPLLNPYFLLNLRAALQIDRWTLRLELRNALNQEYESRGIYASGQAFLTPGAGLAVTSALELRY